MPGKLVGTQLPRISIFFFATARVGVLRGGARARPHRRWRRRGATEKESLYLLKLSREVRRHRDELQREGVSAPTLRRDWAKVDAI